MWLQLGLSLLLLSAPGIIASTTIPEQQPLQPQTHDVETLGKKKVSASRPIFGRFLHITDVHPDPFYRTYSSTSEKKACHRGSGTAGVYGAEVSDCDTPFSLVNETFRWIEENLKDEIDFVVWTGDSARHDNDEKHPRTDKQVLKLNEEIVEKFVEVFEKPDNINDTDPTNDFVVPIVPNFGNNDILPHNIFTPGPNKWTRKYLDLWKKFIPEAQRHTFAFGGWFFTEVVPNKLAVFSLNTMYFFNSNGAVDGCAQKDEPGYQQMEWLRIQLEFLRQRGMKAIMIGHVPPARTKSKMSWDETCWQKYTLWLRQYRDVVVGGLFGHMNIDHFMFQDGRDLEIGEPAFIEEDDDQDSDELVSIKSSTGYLTDLRERWSKIPTPPSTLSYQTLEEDIINDDEVGTEKKKKDKEKERKKFLKKIGGPFAERYSISMVSPSVIPNYYPSLRIIEYNITGIDELLASPTTPELDNSVIPGLEKELNVLLTSWKSFASKKKHNAPEESKKKKKKKHKKPKYPSFPTPEPPSSTSPPGPAYSPQPLTWTRIIQYYANLTYINNDFTDDEIEPMRWREGPHGGKKPPKKPHPKKMEYEVEYDSRNDRDMGNMTDLTVRNYLHRAERIGRYNPAEEDKMDNILSHNQDRLLDQDVDSDAHEGDEDNDDSLDAAKKKKKKDKKKKKRRAINKAWFTFVQRAYVGSMTDEELHENFGQVIE